jgi:monoamine oxidase
LEIAIVGGGTCGLALARDLAERRVNFVLFEARERLGGRVLSVENPTSGLRLDLGPTWFWPDRQPAICRLVDTLGLESFDQHDPGAALLLADPEAPPATRSTPRLHGGAQRLKGGMASLVDALAATLDPQTLRLSHVLRAARDCGDHVELTFDVGGELEKLRARRIALAVPPRLLAEHVRFTPELTHDVRAAMSDAPTWMAAQAKAAIGFAGAPGWRAAGLSGNAFIVHEQAALGEVFDACDAAGEKAALAGFVALSPKLREAFRAGLPMLVASQFVQLFGKGLETGELHLHDWAKEEFTCAKSDLDWSGAHPDYGSGALSQPLWEGRLFLGASETARREGGYVEGALDAAARIANQLAARQEDCVATKGEGAPANVNQSSLALFSAFVASRREAAFADYRRRLNYALSHGQREQLTQRAMLGAMEAIFAEALIEIGELPFDHDGVAIERGRSDLTPRIQAAFDGFIQTLLDAIVAFNATSCALSNFPHEHHLTREYVSTTLRDIAAAWREFSLAANRLLLEKRGFPATAPTAPTSLPDRQSP